MKLDTYLVKKESISFKKSKIKEENMMERYFPSLRKTVYVFLCMIYFYFSRIEQQI